jgi:hypothetical protein
VIQRLAALVLVVLLVASCSLLGFQTGAADPMPAFVTASRATHAATAARWRDYVEADPSLSPLMKDQLVKLFQDWDLALIRAETYLGLGEPPLQIPPLPAPVE